MNQARAIALISIAQALAMSGCASSPLRPTVALRPPSETVVSTLGQSPDASSAAGPSNYAQTLAPGNTWSQQPYAPNAARAMPVPQTGFGPIQSAPSTVAPSVVPPPDVVYLPDQPNGTAPFAAGAPPGGGGQVFGPPPSTAAPPSNPPTYGLPPLQNGDVQYHLSPPENTTPIEAGPPDRYIDLDAYVHEIQTGRFSVGVAVNSNAGLVGSIVIDERNFSWRRWPRSFEDVRNGTAFRGEGQRFRIEAYPGTQVQRYAVSFSEPYLLNTPVSFGLQGYFYNRRFDDWNEERLGGRTSLGYQFTHDLSGTVALRAENVLLFDPAVPTPPELSRALGSSQVYSGQLSFTHDTRDSAFLPTEGHLSEVGFEQAFGTFDYPRFTFDFRKYYLMRERADGSGRHVLSLVGRGGIAGSDTPIFDNFFAGGFSTIRGFNFRGASPLDMGVTVGGQFQFLTSIEYMFPITADDTLRAVVFCDAGTVEEKIAIHWSDFRVAPGFGLRIAVPALGPAPIALDFAFPVQIEDGDDVQNFSFFVGLLR